VRTGLLPSVTGGLGFDPNTHRPVSRDCQPCAIRAYLLPDSVPCLLPDLCSNHRRTRAAAQVYQGGAPLHLGGALPVAASAGTFRPPLLGTLTADSLLTSIPLDEEEGEEEEGEEEEEDGGYLAVDGSEKS
jgi:hypothetical protein